MIMITRCLKLCLLSIIVLTSGCDTSEPEDVTLSNYNADAMLAKSLPEIADLLQKGDLSAEQLVKSYLQRIESVNYAGPELRAVISINPRALERAKELDELLSQGQTVGPLHGVPILVKDNIDTKGMATTVGALALKNNQPERDNPAIAELKKQGAIILGKTNLSQWANFRSEDSMSGWSALGGQVKNPHVLDRNPCGSSSGSGVATAASLAAGSIGTETNGSIICPSNVNGIVGFKPTVGLVSQQYIVPISDTQDTAGPMTKTVKGAAMMLNAMAEGEHKEDYLQGLTTDSLQGVRIGVVSYATGSYQPIKDRFEDALLALLDAGAILIDIDENPVTLDGLGRKAYALLQYEFKDGLNKYLESTDPTQVEVRSLAQLIAFNEAHADKELTLFNQSILEKSEARGPLSDADYLTWREEIRVAMQDNGIDKMLTDNNVSALVAPSGVFAGTRDVVNGDVWPSWPGIGGVAARAGYPHATVPAGQFRNMPIGISFISGKYQDANVLAYAYAYEQSSQLRVAPKYLETAASDPDVAKLLQPITNK